MSLSDPSQPLENQRHEIFAQARSRGQKLSDSWRTTIPFGTEYKGDDVSLRVSGHRVKKRAEVSARIQWLRQQAFTVQANVPETLTRADIITLNLEISDTLQACYETAAKSGNCSPAKLEILRKTLAGHLGRQAKLGEAPGTQLSEPPSEMMNFLASVENMGVCTCLPQ